MNILKNMEAVFISAAAIACTSMYLLGSAPVAHAITQTAAPAVPMQVVVVSAKRMTPDEKLQSMLEERQLAQARSASNRG